MAPSVPSLGQATHRSVERYPWPLTLTRWPLYAQLASPLTTLPAPQTLLVGAPELDWHACLTTSLCFACKVLNDHQVFATDAMEITKRYATLVLLKMETLAFALLLPSIAYIHERAFVFRTSLLDLASDKGPTSRLRVSPTRLHVLVVEWEPDLREKVGVLIATAAPNATVHFAATRMAARAVVDRQVATEVPVHLVLLGGIYSAGAVEPERQESKVLLRDLDPRNGSLYGDMRYKPLIAMLSSSILSRSGHDPHDLYGQGVDAVMAERLDAASLHVLLDFARCRAPAPID